MVQKYKINMFLKKSLIKRFQTIYSTIKQAKKKFNKISCKKTYDVFWSSNERESLHMEEVEVVDFQTGGETGVHIPNETDES